MASLGAGFVAACCDIAMSIVALAAAAAQGTDGGPTPDRPPWVNHDGTTDYSQMPEQIPVIGEDGLPILDVDGEPLTLSREEVAGPPPDGPGSAGPDDGERSVTMDENGNVVETLTQR